MKKVLKTIGLLAVAMLVSNFAFAAEGGIDGVAKIGAGLAISIAALGGALGQGKVAASALEAISRNPSAAGKMNLFFFVGMALIESLVILAFVIALK